MKCRCKSKRSLIKKPKKPTFESSQILTSNIPRLIEYWRTRRTSTIQFINEHNKVAIPNFLKNKTVCSPYLNGTACVGKSTLVKSTNRELAKLNLHVHTLESGVSCSGDNCPLAVKPAYFLPKQWSKGKDKSLIRAMTYQLAFVNYGLKHYTLVGDRCPMNNLIWRFIMMMMEVFDSPDGILINILDKFLDTVPSEFWESCKIIPTIIIVDLDEPAVRQRMVERNEGGDVKRSKTKGYVECQNLVYMEIARRCGYPIIIRQEDMSFLQALLVEKIKSNVAIMGIPEPVPYVEPKEHTKPAIVEENFLNYVAEKEILK